MAWFKSRREIAQLRKQVAALTQAVAQLGQPHGFDAGAFLSALMDGQVKQVGSMTEFMRMIAEVAQDRAAAALGRRGGRKRAATAERDARGRMLPRSATRPNRCLLCVNPLTADFSMDQWQEHQRHKNLPTEPEPRRVAVEEIERPPPQPQPQEYPLPYVAYGDENRGATVRDSEDHAANGDGVPKTDLS